MLFVLGGFLVLQDMLQCNGPQQSLLQALG